MAVPLGLDLAAVEALARAAADGGVCAAATDNAPGQVAISGSRAAVERAIAMAPAHGARKCVELPVSAPFHCSLMAPAAAVLADALAGVEIAPPGAPVVSNVVARATSDPEEIRRLLVEQVTARVRWRESVLYMRDRGVETVAELGPGKVLTGLARRIDRGLEAVSVDTPADIASFLKTI